MSLSRYTVWRGLPTNLAALQTGKGPHNTQLISLYYSFSADTSTNVMSTSRHSFFQLRYHLLTDDLCSHGTSDVAHMESPDATQQEGINIVSLCNGCHLHSLRLSPSHSGCDQRSKA